MDEPLSKDNLIITIEELCYHIIKLRNSLIDIHFLASDQPPDVLKKIQQVCDIAVENSMVLPDKK